MGRGLKGVKPFIDFTTSPMAIIVNARLQIFITAVQRGHDGGVLEYNRGEDGLRVWPW